MVTFDFSPFYRSTIGFDRMARLLENTPRFTEADNGYPPYDIEAAGEDRYRLTVAAAGFSEGELDIEVRDNTLNVTGRHEASDDEAVRYLHQGIAKRAFAKQFRLADHVKVENAWLDNGLLIIDLVRELPDAMKPRGIKITAGAPTQILEAAKKLLSGDKKAA